MTTCENYAPCYPDQPVVDRYLPIWATLPAFRSKPAFIWAEDSSPESTRWSSITYSQLNSSVQAMASQLLLPLRRNETILILCSPGLQLVKVLFACQRAGLIAVPIIPPDSSSFSLAKQGAAHHHLLRAIAQTNPTAAVADPRYISAVSHSAASSSDDQLTSLVKKLRWLSVEDLEGDAHDACRLNSYTREYMGCCPDDTYLIQYTSGATGIPMPVLVPAGAAAHNVREARRAYDLHPASVIVSWLPQYHDCGLMFLLLTVAAGATCVLTSSTAFLHRPRLWLELITEFQATCTPVPSFALPLVLKRGGIDHGKLPLKLGTLRNLVLINEPIYKSSVDEFVKVFAHVGLKPSSISPSYGLAENCTFVSTSWNFTSGVSSSFPNLPSYNKLMPSARLASDGGEEIEILVVDEETCQPVEDGVEGEIWVSSPSNASGYLGHPSLTREVFHARLSRRTSRCFVRTGDRGVVKGKERYLYVVGRTCDVIEVGDRLVHPHYLETAAYDSSPEHLRGGCIAAFGVETQRSRKRTVAVVVVAELQERGQRVDAGAYRSICVGIREAILKQECVPVGLVVLVESGSVPKTTSGKLRRWAAKGEFLDRRLPVVFEVRFDEALSGLAEGENEEDKGIAVKVGSEARVSFSSAGRRPSLLSFL